MLGDAAFRSIEIDKELLKTEIFSLREHYWRVMSTVSSAYDFGFILLDCTVFKERTLKHVQGLIEQMETYVRKEFMSRMSVVQSDVRSVTGKLESAAKSIDEVIQLLDYIEVIRRPDNKVAEIAASIRELKQRMEFVLELKVALKSEEYTQYLQMLNWPKSVSKWLEQRKLELQSAKEHLFVEMGEEKRRIMGKIEEFRAKIASIAREGLVKEGEKGLEQGKKNKKGQSNILSESKEQNSVE